MAAQHLLISIVLGLAGLQTAACARWPAEVGGGLAERYALDEPALLALSERYAHIAHAGGKRHYPARLIQVRLRINRAIREHAGGLYADAHASVYEAHAMLDAIQEALRDVPH